MANEYSVTARNKVKRVPQRGAYDKETLYKVLDAGFICNAGFVVDNQPFVIPTIYGREGNKIYFHGATTSRMLVNLKKGVPVCISVTHLDGLVLARSAFHHSMNYRSAVIFGNAKEVTDDRKEHALKVVSENIMGGRWDEVRGPNTKELKATSVLEIEIDQASTKIRTGPPKDEPEDYDLDIWAGVVPIKMTVESPVNDDQLKQGLHPSENITAYSI